MATTSFLGFPDFSGLFGGQQQLSQQSQQLPAYIGTQTQQMGGTTAGTAMTAEEYSRQLGTSTSGNMAGNYVWNHGADPAADPVDDLKPSEKTKADHAVDKIIKKMEMDET